MKKFFMNLKIKILQKKGYNYFTLTENGIVTQVLFYR
jgi:hypothetical protein